MMQKRYADFLRNFRADSVFKQKAASVYCHLLFGLLGIANY